MEGVSKRYCDFLTATVLTRRSRSVPTPNVSHGSLWWPWRLCCADRLICRSLFGRFFVKSWSTHTILYIPVYLAILIHILQHKRQWFPRTFSGFGAHFQSLEACCLASLALHLSIRRFHCHSDLLFFLKHRRKTCHSGIFISVFGSTLSAYTKWDIVAMHDVHLRFSRHLHHV